MSKLNRNKNRVPNISNKKRGNKPMTSKEKKMNRHYPFLPEEVEKDEVITDKQSELLNETTSDQQDKIEKMFEGTRDIINEHYGK